jgi:hypothetical protein
MAGVLERGRIGGTLAVKTGQPEVAMQVGARLLKTLDFFSLQAHRTLL